jgi:hypothetical protein
VPAGHQAQLAHQAAGQRWADLLALPAQRRVDAPVTVGLVRQLEMLRDVRFQVTRRFFQELGLQRIVLHWMRHSQMPTCNSRG